MQSDTVGLSKGCKAGAAAAPASGVSHGQITSDGIPRTYRLFVPPGAKAPKAGHPEPLVVDIHGYSEGDDLHASFTGWEAKAGQDGFVVLSPEGQTDLKFWNLGISGKGHDDVVTIGNLLDHIEATTCIDTNRVYVDGFSNGAMLTSVLACRLSDRFAAFGPVSGIWMPGKCSPKRAVPIIAFHGTDDPFLSYNGGVGPKAATLPIDHDAADALGGFAPGPVPQSTKAWAQRDGCKLTPAVTKVAPHVTRTAYTRCRDGAEVELYTEQGAGHSWAGSKPMKAIEGIVGPVNYEINTTDLLWDFFKAHPLTSHGS